MPIDHSKPDTYLIEKAGDLSRNNGFAPGQHINLHLTDLLGDTAVKIIQPATNETKLHLFLNN